MGISGGMQLRAVNIIRSNKQIIQSRLQLIQACSQNYQVRPVVRFFERCARSACPESSGAVPSTASPSLPSTTLAGSTQGNQGSHRIAPNTSELDGQRSLQSCKFVSRIFHRYLSLHDILNCAVGGGLWPNPRTSHANSSMLCRIILIRVAPQTAVAEVFVNHGWQSGPTNGPKGG